MSYRWVRIETGTAGVVQKDTQVLLGLHVRRPHASNPAFVPTLTFLVGELAVPLSV